MNTPSPESPQRWQALVLLTFTLILSMSTWFSASAVVPQLRTEWNLSNDAAAWLTIAVQLGFAVGAVISSLLNLSDIMSPRHVILGGAVGAGIVNAFLGVVDSATLGIPLRFLTGVFLAGVYPPAMKLMSTWFRQGRGMALGVMVGAVVVGSALPHLVNGLGGLYWQTVIYATTILSIIGGLIAEFVVKEGPYPFPKAIFDWRQAGRAFANRGVRLASFGYFGHMWELYAMYAWFSLFFGDALRAQGIPVDSTAAYTTFVVMAVGAVGSWAGGILADRWGRANTTTLMMVISASCALLIGLLFGSSPWLIVVVGLVWGFSIVADSAQFSTLVTEYADQAYVGTALTLQLASGFALTVITIWLIPLLEAQFGWRWAFAFLAPGPILGAVAMMRLKMAER
jgi:MFS family permease